jgi:hypothetical protein
MSRRRKDKKMLKKLHHSRGGNRTDLSGKRGYTIERITAFLIIASLLIGIAGFSDFLMTAESYDAESAPAESQVNPPSPQDTEDPSDSQDSEDSEEPGDGETTEPQDPDDTESPDDTKGSDDQDDEEDVDNEDEKDNDNDEDGKDEDDVDDKADIDDKADTDDSDYDPDDVDAEALAMALSAPPKEIPIIIGKMTIEHNGNPYIPDSEIVFKSGDRLIMNFTWEVDYSEGYVNILAGDTAEVRLWKNDARPPISLNSIVSGELTVDGVPVGTMDLHPGGMLYMTFNDKLQGDFDVHGDISVETYIDFSKITESEITIEFFGEEFEYIFRFERVSGGGQSIAKRVQTNSFTWNQATGIQRVHWVIDVNTRLDPALDGDGNAIGGTVEDVLTPSGGDFVGHALIDVANVKVFELDIDPSDGTPGGGIRGAKPADPDDYDVEISSDKLTLTVTFRDLNRRAFRIEFDTVPTGDRNNQLYYKNEATLTIGDSTATSPAEQQNVPPTPVDIINRKTGSFHTGTATSAPYIVWEIEVNRFGAAFAADLDLIINDVLQGGENSDDTPAKPGQHFTENSLMGVWSRSIVDFSTNDPVYGHWTPVDDGEYDFEFDLDVVDRFKLTVDKGILNYTHEDYGLRGNSFLIRFRSEVTDTPPYKYDDNIWVHNYWRNDADINHGNNDTWGVHNYGGVGYSLDPYITKTTTSITTGIGTGTIGWKILVNPVARTLNNIVIDDVTSRFAGASATQTLIEPITVKALAGGGLPEITLTEAASGANTYKVDITTPDTITDANTGSFTITLDPDFELKGRQLEITFSTTYNLGAPSALGQYDYNIPNNLIRLYNRADVSANKVGVLPTEWTGWDQTYRDIPVTQFRNLAKSGSYSGGRFNWTIDFNHVNDAYIADTITIEDTWTAAQQTLDPDTIKVFVGGVEQTRNVGYSVKTDVAGRFELTISNVSNKAVKVTYQTIRIPDNNNTTIYSNSVTVAVTIG